ncbi:MAG: peptidoglycan-binding protein [Caproiciproducens sp.]|nr:peptidoglycan-binding protein [Caproiciproducens sp.]
MLKKITAIFLCVLIVTGALAACGPKNDISSGAGVKDFPVTIGNVTINQEPTGAVVLSPNVADVILAMQYEIQLKAKSAECTQSDLAVLPNVTADDVKQIKDLGANLVLTDTELTKEQTDALQKEGITVLTVAKATGREDMDRLYSQVGLTIDDISRIIPKSNTPTSVAYLFDTDGGVVTGDTLEGKLIESAGLINAAADGVKNQMKINELLIANPKYIFCPTGLKAKLAQSAEYKKLTAVQQGKVYEMDPNLMLLQGRGVITAVSFMAGTVYPELLAGTEATSSGSSSTSSGSTASTGSSTSSTAGAVTGTLKKGDQGAEVLKMQNRLKELGYMFMTPNGTFGDGTEQSVKDFQLLNGYETTGVADAKTLQKMFSSDAKKRTN